MRGAVSGVAAAARVQSGTFNVVQNRNTYTEHNKDQARLSGKPQHSLGVEGIGVHCNLADQRIAAREVLLGALEEIVQEHSHD